MASRVLGHYVMDGAANMCEYVMDGVVSMIHLALPIASLYLRA